ncbi:glyceraldehyde 3-phosphate dehydrogenase NAD-binding domain-containing protein [Streptomyces sp. NPDC006208]|uniref:glyceraldehyde 3-phosphate dehydrogenase NAD-binding domain-containing protein n=1 Tax=Streptomyces sp. NPDC006208 TaxID=3156734 RepID=UPI0033BF83F3
MTVRIGINGLGQVGRTYPRAAPDKADADASPIEVVAINDLASPEALDHLLANDSTQGRLGAERL